MNNEQKEVLNLPRLPARMNIVQVAACLGFKPHDLPILVARGLLKPLGQPTPSSEKYFSRKKVLGLEDDEEWLSRATATLSQHWQAKNARKSKRSNGVVIHMSTPVAR